MAQKLTCTREFNPVLFIGESWSAAEEDERANALTEIDVGAIALVSCLKIGDHIPTGEECLRRLKEIPQCSPRWSGPSGIRKNQRLIPDNGKTHLSLCSSTGSFSRHRQRHHYSPYLILERRRMAMVLLLLGNTRSSSSQSAVLASS